MGINWTQIAGMICGAAFVSAVFLIVAWHRARKRRALSEQPPQRTKLLRPAGYSLQCRIDDVSERWLLAVLQALMSGCIIGVLCAGLYPVAEGLVLRRFTFTELTKQPNSYMLLGVFAFLIAAAAWLIKSLAEAFALQKELRNCRFGLRGEQAVTEALNDRAVSTAGYIVFHDVPGDGQWNIDHVIIGPGGVFVLETKARSRRKSMYDQQDDHEVLFDGARLQFPWCDDDKSVKQAIRNAEWVRRFVKGFGPKDILVQPIIVVPGWYVKTQGRHPVKVMNASYLALNYLPSIQRRFRAEELTAIVRRFDERCRDLEF